jgi:hypothetical protein
VARDGATLTAGHRRPVETSAQKLRQRRYNRASSGVARSVPQRDAHKLGLGARPRTGAVTWGEHVADEQYDPA